MIAAAFALAVSGPVAAQPAPPPAPAPGEEVAPEQALTQKIAVWRIDALGISPELVARLEALFRMELDRLATRALPGRREIDRAIGGDRRLAGCGGEDDCLAAIGKKLGVDVVVTGSVAAMGDNYILNIKAVDVAKGTQIRRIATEPLRGSPDELIDSIRVAAYRLLAPAQLHGAVSILSDMVGGTVTLDGKVVGTTPLPRPLSRLSLGEHTLRVELRGYMPFEDKVVVRFQKTTRVVVRLAPAEPTVEVGPPRVVQREARPWYSSKWFYVGVGVAAVVIGVSVGQALGEPTIVRCGEQGCRP
jgi:hypothetical protein